MKLTAIAASVPILVLVIVYQAQIPVQQKNEGAEQELIRLENAWADAWVKSDAAFYDRITTDDYTWGPHP